MDATTYLAESESAKNAEKDTAYSRKVRFAWTRVGIRVAPFQHLFSSQRLFTPFQPGHLFTVDSGQQTSVSIVAFLVRCNTTQSTFGSEKHNAQIIEVVAAPVSSSTVSQKRELP